jgi:predicted ribosome-associated RNA-binding protein Tma20
VHLQKFYKKAAAFVLRAVAKHSPQLAKSVVDSGAVDALVTCLEEFDPGVKEQVSFIYSTARINCTRRLLGLSDT